MLTCHGAHYLLLVVKGKGHEPIALIDRTDTRKTSLTPDSIEQEKMEQSLGNRAINGMFCRTHDVLHTSPTTTKLSIPIAYREAVAPAYPT